MKFASTYSSQAYQFRLIIDDLKDLDSLGLESLRKVFNDAIETLPVEEAIRLKSHESQALACLRYQRIERLLV